MTITKDIKADFGAVGNAQVATASLSITSGTKNLSSTTALWSAGDVGKSIVIPGAGTGVAALLDTSITAFTDSQHVTVNANASVTLTNSSQMIVWGTSDAAAFQSFKTWAQAQSDDIVLNLPGNTGGYAQAGRFVGGILSLRVVGTSNPVLTDAWLGADTTIIQAPGGFCTARIASCGAGSTTIRLLDLADVPKFTAGHTLTQSNGFVYTFGSYIKISCLDMQGFGDPNHFIWEWARIASIDAATGIITLTAPLRYGYDSHYPLYTAGGAFQVDEGGPATAYAFDAAMECSLEYVGLRFYCPGAQINSPGRNVTFTGCTWLQNDLRLGPNPSTNESWIADSCNLSECSIEVDKTIVDLVIRNNSSVRTIWFQSASTERFTASDSTLTTIQGGPKVSTLNRCTIGTLQLGTEAYGRANSIEANNCVISSITAVGATDTDVTANGFTCVNGYIFHSTVGGPIRWAVPGTRINFHGSSDYGDTCNIQDVEIVGGVTRIATDLPGPTWPNVPLQGGTRLDISAHPSPAMYFTNCTGCNDAINFSQPGAYGKPYASYSKWTYTGNTLGTTLGSAYAPNLWGTVTLLRVNVTQAYTGPLSTLTMDCFGQFDGRAIINLKIAGLRTLAPSVSGAQIGDTLGNAGSFGGSCQPFISANISAESAANWPIVEIEVVTTQKFPNRALRGLSRGRGR